MARRAGEFDTRLRLQSFNRVDDGGGGTPEDWDNIAWVWAKVETLNGIERFQAQQVQSAVTHRVTILNRTVVPQQRFLYGSRALHITSIVHGRPRSNVLECMCEERNVA